MRLREIFEDQYDPVPLVKYLEKGVTPESAGKAIADIIKDECQEWLGSTGGNIVYRGTNYSAIAYRRAVRSDREPKDSPEVFHDLFNKFIARAGGVANRTNSLFVTGDYGDAEGYGHPYVVFPVGHFNYTWNEKWGDLYFDLFNNGAIEQLIKPSVVQRNEEIYLKAAEEKAAEFFQSQGWDIADKNRKELWDKLVHAEMYKLRMKRRYPQRTEDYDITKAAETFVVDKRLEHAIVSAHEIMVKCDSAIYVDPEFYMEHVKKLIW
jgi:hypothetical protein